MQSPANFSLVNQATAAGAGGLLYGGVYTGAKALMDDKDSIDKDELVRELVANSLGGAASGVGIYSAGNIPQIYKRIKQKNILSNI